MYNSSSSSMVAVLGTGTAAGTIVLANAGVSYFQILIYFIIFCLISVFGYIALKSLI